MTTSSAFSRRRPARQRGVVLFISLIVLVAMSLAGIAMIRSVDTGLGVAGNLAFKQAAVQSTDTGFSTAYAFIASQPITAWTADIPANGFFSSLTADADWTNSANWGQAIDVYPGGGTDAAGNRIRYIIHRMCLITGAYNSGGQQCALYVPTGGGTTGSTQTVGAYQFAGQPQVYLRVTTRVDGPRNTVSITQTSVLVDAS